MRVQSYQAPNFVGGHPVIMKRLTLASPGAGGTETELLAGTILGEVTATEKYVPWSPAATDGSETAAAILVEDVVVPAAGDASANAYVHGEFRRKGLNWPETATDAQKTQAIKSLAAGGLYVK